MQDSEDKQLEYKKGRNKTFCGILGCYQLLLISKSQGKYLGKKKSSWVTFQLLEMKYGQVDENIYLNNIVNHS